MPDKNQNEQCRNLRETVCINVDRVYDACKDKDCAVDLRVYVSPISQAIIDTAVSVRPLSAELIWTYLDVEALPFNKGFYTVDVKYFFRTSFDVFNGNIRPTRVEGLAAYSKRVVLFGSEGGAAIYSSLYVPTDQDVELLSRSNLPKATVEVVPPVILDAKAIDASENYGTNQIDIAAVPAAVSASFGETLADPDTGKHLYATLGIFSIIRLMREVQLLIPSYDFCIPSKECCGPIDDDPCSLFNQMEFPQDEFFPPASRCCME